MQIAELLAPDFMVNDALDARSADQLASACQCLDITLPALAAPSDAASENRLARARAERQTRLSEALAQALGLVQSSGYDIQALTVLMRLSIEADGLAGAEQALLVLSRMLNQGWSGLLGSIREQPEREREKLQRKWGRYLDAVFEQLYLWLAREHERDRDGLAERLGSRRGAWTTLRGEVERGLASSSAHVARFEAVSGLLEGLCRAASPELAAAEPSTATSASDVKAASLAPTRALSDAEPGDRVAPAAAHEARALLQVSGRFWELNQRLAAFAELLGRREYEKAGIVAADLQKTLDQFDVAAYFPGLFARYFEFCAEHARPLLQHQPDEAGLRSAALARLYRTDLPRFLALPEPLAHRAELGGGASKPK
jgi:hypothetical protein